jgi:hypothetical protein
MHEFLNEKFAGLQTLSGDDKFLTRWVINHGYKTYHQLGNTTKLSTTFDSGPKLFRQLIRWSRNTWRSDIKNLFFERKIWSNTPFTAIVMLDKFWTPIFLLGGPIYLLTLFFINAMPWSHLVAWGIWLIVSRSVRLIYHFAEHPYQLIYLPIFVLFQYLQAFIRIYALFTLRNRSWGTRAVTVNKDGQIARTGEMQDYDGENNDDEQQFEIPVNAVISPQIDPIRYVEDKDGKFLLRGKKVRISRAVNHNGSYLVNGVNGVNGVIQNRGGNNQYVSNVLGNASGRPTSNSPYLINGGDDAISQVTNGPYLMNLNAGHLALQHPQKSYLNPSNLRIE